MKNPVEILRAKLISNESDAVLITSDVNRRYFSSFKSSAGVIFITAKEAIMLMDFRYAEAASYKAKNVTVKLTAGFESDLATLVK